MVYNFAQEELSGASLEQVTEAVKKVEESAQEQGIQEKYVKILEKWEEKVL